MNSKTAQDFGQFFIYIEQIYYSRPSYRTDLTLLIANASMRRIH